MIAALCVGYALDPQGWQHYASMAGQAKLQNEFIPTLSVMFRLVIHRPWIWLQFVPAAVACAWAALRYMEFRERWDWMEQCSLLLLISVMVAPYAWFSDEAVLLPAVLCALYGRMRSGRSMLPFSLLMGIALVQVLAGVSINSGFYIWTAPAWFVLWLMRDPLAARSARSELPLVIIDESVSG